VSKESAGNSGKEERWRKIEDLYHTALERESRFRVAYVRQVCAGDESLEREVLSLLAESEGTEDFLEAPALEVAAKSLSSDGRCSELSEIGRYRVIRLLGEGGMGAVYEAEQDEPKRTVALKIIKLGLATPDRLRRFRQESRALARLQHPGIAQIYESGTADTGFGPQPYFAMELIRGLPLLRFAECNHLKSDQRLSLMVKICEAVDHAHQRGLIHRDLKPGNILVDETGQPKVLDFGVARIAEAETPEGSKQPTLQTSLGQIVGTLAYMSPEQVLGDPLEVDTRSDVYSLGVILYQLLCGRPPYEVSHRSLSEAVHTIREEEPASIRAIDRNHRGDIETLVGKALEKDKARRYASGADFAADIQRYLDDEPITAHPPSGAYRLRKFARRNRGLVAAVAAVFVVLLSGVVVSTSQAFRANRAGQAALRERDRAAAAEQTARQAEWTATDERNRAMAAETQAIEERNRALIERQRADDESAIAKAVNGFLQNDLLAQAGVSAQAGHGTKPDPDLKVRTALDRAAAGVSGRFQKQPLVEAAIRQTIGRAYLDLGVYGEAEKQMARALELRRGAVGDNRPETLESARDLGLTYYDEGKYPQAEGILTETLQVQRRVFGPKHPSTARTMNDLAELYKEEGKLAPAERLVLGALDVQRAVLGPEHPDTLNTMYDLASLYRAEGAYQKAEPLFTKVIGVQRRVLGESHPNTLSSMSSLANLYRLEGKYGEAEPLQIMVVEIQHRLLGDEHNETLTAMSNLAVLYDAEGKYPQEEPLLSKVVEIRRRVLGEEHPSTATSLNNLAVLYGKEGKWGQAEPLVANSVAIRRRVLGEQHPLTLLTMTNLAVVYQKEGKFADAETLSTNALDTLRRVAGEDKPETLSAMSTLGLLYRGEAKYTQAEPLLVKVLEIRRRVLGPEHPDTLKSMHNLADLYRSQGNTAEAAALFPAVLEARRRILGPAHPDTLDTMTSLGEVRLRQEKYADAETLLREVQKNRPRTASDSWIWYWREILLGASLAGQHQYGEAEQLLLSGYQEMSAREASIPFEDRDVLNEAGDWIVQLYEKLRMPERVSEWREKVHAK